MPVRRTRLAIAIDYGGSRVTGAREANVLRVFSAWMRHQKGASIRTVARPLERGLIKMVNGATVDGVLATARGNVAVELVGYSPLRDRGDVMARDFHLRAQLTGTLGRLLRRKRCSLSLTYKSVARKGGGGVQFVKHVPTIDAAEAIARELKGVIDSMPAQEFNQFVWAEFTDRDRPDGWGGRPGIKLLSRNRFPLCGAHFTSVQLQGVDDLVPTIGSDLKAGSVGLNEMWLANEVQKKALKSCRLSAPRAIGLPLWLIVHSDGLATHQTIHRMNRPRALEVSRAALCGEKHCFARAYWADGTAFTEADWVGRIL